MDVRLFRTVEKIGNKETQWREWITHMLAAVRDSTDELVDAMEQVESPLGKAERECDQEEVIQPTSRSYWRFRLSARGELVGERLGGLEVAK